MLFIYCNKANRLNPVTLLTTVFSVLFASSAIAQTKCNKENRVLCNSQIQSLPTTYSKNFVHKRQPVKISHNPVKISHYRERKKYIIHAISLTLPEKEAEIFFIDDDRFSIINSVTEKENECNISVLSFRDEKQSDINLTLGHNENIYINGHMTSFVLTSKYKNECEILLEGVNLYKQN